MADQGEVSCPIVGIGASAGGLEALSELVKAIPEHTGMAFVIIQHLSPDHPSMMDQLLSSHAALPVKKIEDGERVQPDTIYVLPEGPSATVEGSTLHLHKRDEGGGLRTPIDQFLQSLAAARERSAFAVILSGTGSDGTLGVRAIKEAGGFAIVQQSESARFPGMPESAAATGLVDFALKPKKIPGRLLDILHHRREVLSDAGAEQLREEIDQALPEILETLDDEHGHDFSEYKKGTILRRIERRMIVTRQPDVDAFIDTLRANASERSRLYQDFLIGVTRFFRDEEAFETLDRLVVRPLVEEKQGALRVWVPGCSTGEEAYSIAMLFAEAMDDLGHHRQWQIFGTDIDPAALTHARNGIYTESQLEGLSQSRRNRFFVPIEGNYQVAPLLRERCIFAPHNLLQDPPFSRLDLVSCRNLLIYLTSEVQGTVIPRFHYALNQGGYLFLGPSESLGKQDRFFDTLDRDNRIFARNDKEQPAFSSLKQNRHEGIRRERRLTYSASPSAPDMAVADAGFEHQLLSHFARQSAAPFATVNASDEVSYLSARMSAYVRPAQGVPSASLDQFLVRDLRLPVRAALEEARKKNAPATTRNVVVNDVGEPHLVDIEAAPLPFAEGSVLVTLQPVRTQNVDALIGSTDVRSKAEREQIERELAITRQQLSSTRSNYETTEQELKSSNEELLSMNEELQSSNEELETSREELQSINEELETVNAELTENNRRLASANSDLKNLFDSTDIATVFLDQSLCVRRFTPASRRLFGIQERDEGRSINDLKWKVDYDDLEEDAALVTDTLRPIEREVKIEATGETFLMRIRPYRRTDDRIDGCILTFIDITERTRAAQQLRDNAETLAKQYAELETLYDTTPVGLDLLDKDLRYLRINKRLAEINGLPVEEHIGKTQEELIPDIDNKIRDLQLKVLRTGIPSLGHEVRGFTPANPDEERDWVVDYYPVRTAEGETFALGCCVTEVTEQKQLQRKIEQALEDLTESEARLGFALETSRLGAWELDVATSETERTPLHDRIFGYDTPLDAWNFEIFLDHVLPEDRAQVQEIFQDALDNGGNLQFQCRIVRVDGEMRWIEAHGRPRTDTEGHTIRLMGTVQDITDRKEAEEQQSLLLHELQHRVKNTMATTLAIVQFSAKRASSVEAFTETLRRRLHAIARTHDHLTASEWRGAVLSDIVRREAKPYTADAPNRITFTGTNPLLSPKQTLALTLAFHELATNAAKYGALSVPKGKVFIESNLDENRCLELIWREQNGPDVVEPEDEDTGFGTFLLKKVLGPDLHGEASMTYAEDGVTWRTVFPLERTE